MESVIVRHLVNTEHAIRMVEALPAHKIDLAWWTMGRWGRGFMPFTIGPSAKAVMDPENHNVVACFGGLVAADPFYQQQGVRRGWITGRPLLRGFKDMSSQSISQHLFGKQLFYWNAAERYDTMYHKSLLLCTLRQHRDHMVWTLTRRGMEKVRELARAEGVVV